MSAPAAYQRNGTTVGADAFYRVACDPQRHVAVEACAGAGKTWMLVSRIVRALLDGAQPQEILAITFTKKAAGEMRARLTQWLEQFAQASDAGLQHELAIRGVLPESQAALVQPMRELQGHLLSLDRSVQIRTFHSWFASLLRNAPMGVLAELGLPLGFDLLEDDKQAVALVWRPLRERLLGDPGLREDYEALIRLHGRSSTEKALEAALARRVEFQLADAAGQVSRSVDRLEAWCPDFSGLDSALEILWQPAVQERWSERAKALGREANKTPREAATAIVDALALLAGRDPAQLEPAFLKLRNAIFVKTDDRVTRNLLKFEAATQAEPELLQLVHARRQQAGWEHQQRMARLTRVLCEEYARVKRDNGWVDMNDVERAALYLLSDPVAGSWVQERLDAQTRHLLIDEFQDTNPLQWQALQAWLSGYGGSGGGATAPRLFIVGDPKQSIYRFRRAEPQVFIAAQAFVRALGGDLLSCDHTRRNAPRVLAAVNAVLGAAEQAGEFRGFRPHTTASEVAGSILALPAVERPARAGRDDASADPDDFTTAWRDSLTTPRVVPEESLRGQESRQVALWIRHQLAQGLEPGQLMVLARKRDRLSALESELRRAGVAAPQPEKTDLGECPEVQDVVALLDVLVSPDHDLSLARALRSPLWSLDDDELVQLALARRRQQSLAVGGARVSWLDLLLSGDGPTTPFRVRRGDEPALLDGSWTDLGLRLARWRQWVTDLPPHDALQAIYDDGDVVARYVSSVPASMRQGVRANLLALAAAALGLDGGRYATPYALVRALRGESLRAPQSGTRDAVQLLTVHGAKGLEAECVVMLDTDAPPPPSQTMGVLVDWPGEAAHPLRFVFLARETEVPPSAQALMDQELAERQREELNALYVALTRAQRQIVLSAAEPARDSGLSWYKRLLPHTQACPAPDDAHGPDALDGSDSSKPRADVISLPVLPPTRFDVAPAVPSDVPSPEARVGSAMHRLLEWTGLDARDVDTGRLDRLQREFELDAPQLAQAVQFARTILQGEGAWAWQSASVQWHGAEVPVVHRGQLLRMDRLVRHVDGTWWVLDYKSASQPQRDEALRAQLLGYRDAVQAAMADDVNPAKGRALAVRVAFLTAQGRMEELT